MQTKRYAGMSLHDPLPCCKPFLEINLGVQYCNVC